MNALNTQYKEAKQRAMQFMKAGNISAYLQALSEMNQFKKMMMMLSYN